MIKGIGIDSIENDRIYRILSKHGYRFQDKILGPEEKKEIEIKSNNYQKARYLSNNFACKEALSKALGLGFAGGVSFKEIQILRDPQYLYFFCLLYTSPSPRDTIRSRMPSSA